MTSDTLIGLDPNTLTREELERQYDALAEQARDMLTACERHWSASQATLLALDPFAK